MRFKLAQFAIEDEFNRQQILASAAFLQSGESSRILGPITEYFLRTS